jgi:cysteinyl-tRNA synthetase
VGTRGHDSASEALASSKTVQQERVDRHARRAMFGPAMSELRLYNTLTRNLEPFVPARPGEARVYLCGPTVYDVPHAGHARSAVACDVLVRRLRHKGLKVTYVRNYTDIDDKILARAKENGEPPVELARRMAEIYAKEIAEVGCLQPDHEPRVSQHLPEIFELIGKLVKAGAAYVVDMPSGTRDVYFSVRSFPGYGKLSRRRIDELEAGARVEVDENKRDPLDFALWKGAPRDEWGWESPWGWGRPGWHIECSAMSARYLGHGFDLHCGGMDLIFPHHENEIAQSEAAHPGAGEFVRAWVHNGFLTVDKEKMSKSLGNFVTVEDVLCRNDPEAFRWFLLTVSYRGPIQFDTETLPDGRVVFPGVDEAERRVDYLYSTLRRLEELLGAAVTVPAKLPPELAAHGDAIARAGIDAEAGLDDDLNTPVALAALGEMARHANEVADLAQKRRKDAAMTGGAAVVARHAKKAISTLAGQLGLLRASERDYARRTRERRLGLRKLDASSVDAKIAERAAARSTKDFPRADAIRAELAAHGVELMDGPAGTEWSVAP